MQTHRSPHNRIAFDEFEIDMTRRKLSRNGEPLQINAKTYELLELLLSRNGTMVTKNEILDTIWAGQYVEESNLTVQISALRKALGENSRSPQFLVTIPGKGYKFSAELREADPEVDGHPQATEGAVDTIGKSAGIGRAQKRLRWVMVVGLLAGATVLFALAYAITTLDSRAREQTDPRDVGVRQLTTSGRVDIVELSPGGEFFLYGLRPFGEYRNSLHLGQISGGKDIELLPPTGNLIRYAKFSPDGQWIYFSRIDSADSEGGFYRMPVLGGVPEKIASHPLGRFDLSPDGTQIAFFREDKEAGYSSIWTSNLDGTKERQIASRPYANRFSSRLPVWSPDGTMFAVGAISDPVRRTEDIYAIDVVDGRERQITQEHWLQVQNLVWRPNNSGLIAIATDNREAELHLWSVEYPSGRVRRISRDTDTLGSGLSISPDGKAFLATRVQRESNIWIAPADDLSKALQITFSSTNGMYGWFGLDWAADDRIVFSAGVDRTTALFSTRNDGTDVREITSGGFYDRNPKVTADGKNVVFGSNRGGTYEIWRVGHDGNNIRQLTTGGRNFDPFPTPDGKWIVYTSERDGGRPSLWRVPIEGGEPIRLTNLRAEHGRISPDGTMIACVLVSEDFAEKTAILNFSDGSLIRQFEAPSTYNPADGFRWTPDGKAFTYRDWADGIWKQHIDGGPPAKLEGLPNEKIYAYTWSPDGQRFAFTRGREMSDAVLFTNF